MESINKPKILIVENNNNHFKLIYNELFARLKDVDIYPKNVEEIPTIIGKIKDKSYEFNYGEIDLFIIDISLEGDRDTLGLDFVNFLENDEKPGNIKSDDYEYLIVTKYDRIVDFSPKKYSQEIFYQNHYINKGVLSFDREDLPNDDLGKAVYLKIKNIYNIK